MKAPQIFLAALLTVGVTSVSMAQTTPTTTTPGNTGTMQTPATGTMGTGTTTGTMNNGTMGTGTTTGTMNNGTMGTGTMGTDGTMSKGDRMSNKKAKGSMRNGKGKMKTSTSTTSPMN